MIEGETLAKTRLEAQERKSAAEVLAAGMRLRSDGDVKGAIEAFSYGAEAFPAHRDHYGHPAFQKELVRILVDSQRWEDALSLVARKNSPDRTTWHEILFARAYTRIGDFDNALTWWTKVSHSQPGHHELEPWISRIPRMSEPFKSLAEQVRSFRLNVIFDVGANVGQSSVEFARMFPAASIHAFEPVPASFEKLVGRTAELKNVTKHNLALGGSEGSLMMSAHGDSTMNRVENVADGVEVSATRLDTFCAAHGFDTVDFLKIDTEGFDLNVLKGCGDFIHNISYIQCEASANDYNQFHNSYVEIYDFLTEAGFYVFLIHGQTHEWGNGGYPVLRRFDAVFVNRSVVGEMTDVMR